MGGRARSDGSDERRDTTSPRAESAGLLRETQAVVPDKITVEQVS